jgi:two-component system LytT family response regulator
MTDGVARVTALVVDDEPLARAGLRAMLEQVDWIACIGECATGTAAIDAIDRLRPDLVFLDIEMPGVRGTDVMRATHHRPHVIFTTAWSQHAAEAFELGAIDYLLKPFGSERLHLALERSRAALGETDVTPALDRYREALASGPMTRLFVRSGRTIVPIAVDAVSRFEADGDYVAIHVGSARYLAHLALARLEARLDPARFVRIHRTTIVNLDRVKAFRSLAGARLVAELEDGTRLEVSRTRAKAIRALGR